MSSDATVVFSLLGVAGVLFASGRVRLDVTAILVVLALMLTGCISMDQSYRAIQWSSIVLIAGMLPLADAVEQTGGVDVVVDLLVSGLGEASPYKTASALFFLTAGLGLVLSNTATAILVAPVAVRSAEVLGVSPYPLAMMVAIAASAAFVTPVSTPVVTLVVAPGGYRFMDFVRVGFPLLILTWLTALVVTPLMYPF